MRILPIERIPIDLWHNGLLRLPSHLKASYLAHLDKFGLRASACEHAEGEVYGGLTQRETHEHFAKRFAVSAGRTEYAALGPCDGFESLSEAFFSTFSDGPVALLDIPCGTGATSCALVSTLTKLRADSILPRLPLTINICGGDVSPEALSIFSTMLAELADPAAAQGISLRWESHQWDAIKSDHTARLIDRWFKFAANATEHFVVLSNFSGALHNAGRFEAFSPCFEHILARLHDKRSTVVWIEPATNSVKEGAFTTSAGFFYTAYWLVLQSKP